MFVQTVSRFCQIPKHLNSEFSFFQMQKTVSTITYPVRTGAFVKNPTPVLSVSVLKATLVVCAIKVGCYLLRALP